MTPAPLCALTRWRWLAWAVLIVALVANYLMMQIGG